MKFAAFPSVFLFALALPLAAQEAQPASATPANPFQGLSNSELTDKYRDTLKNVFMRGQFAEAAKIFKNIVKASTHPELTANSLFLLANSQIRSGDYTGCADSIHILTTKYADSNIVRSGKAAQFLRVVIDRTAVPPTSWDYERYQEGVGDDGKPIWKESVPPGRPVRRINIRLPFRMYASLERLMPRSPEVLQAKQKLEAMLAAPVTVRWVDEKAMLTPWGHPADFFSKLRKREKQHFSEVICERMFYDWKTDKMHLVLDMYDDVRNLRHRYTARSRDPESKDAVAGFTLAQLFATAGYDPYTDTFGSTTEQESSVDLQF